VRNVISKRWNPGRSSSSTLIICDPLCKEVQIAHGVHVVVKIYIVRIDGVKHQVHIVAEPELQMVTSSAEADLLMYRSRADEIFAAHQWLNMLCAAYRGNMRPVTVVMRGLNDSIATQDRGER